MSTQTGNPNWTILIYFAADNDLDEAAFEVLREIKKVGSNRDLNVIAQLDTRGVGHTFRFRLRDQRYTIDEDRIPHPDENREINTGDPRELTKFIKWSVKNFPADHYMLVIWGHGQGWETANDDHAPTRVGARTVSKFLPVDDQMSMSIGDHGKLRLYMQQSPESGNAGYVPSSLSMNTLKEFTDQLLALYLKESGNDPSQPPVSRDVLKSSELSEALKDAFGSKKLDILGMDACMMGMAEVGYHIRHSARYMIASEDTVPLESWPYARILTAMRERPDMEPEELSVTIIREYLTHYQNEVKGATLSACNLEKDVTDRLVDALGLLTGELKEKMPAPAVRFAVMKARIAAQSFYLKEFVDLYDFCEQLRYIVKWSSVTTGWISRRRSITAERWPAS